MKNSIYSVVLSMLVSGLALSGCTSGDSNNDKANNVVACRLDAFNQCFEWVNLPGSLVDSLQSTCVNDDNGILVDACPTENMIGICEEVGDPVIPDLLNFFYLSPTATDPVAYASLKEQACIDAGGNWTPVN